MRDFAAAVLQWFERHGRRNLPWQQSPDPYRVWVSEIMLQQTQVATVIPYYRRFMRSFPDVVALADAGIDEVLHHWSGLGYYARARNLHESATIVRDDYGGEFPRKFDDVMALPGVGRSTAGAILSLALQQRHPILDGNVKRVLCRYFAVDGWPGRSAVAHELWHLAEEHTPQRRVAQYNQAMMDLGATVCTRGKPRCEACPLAASCRARLEGRTTALPAPKPRKSRPLRSRHVLIVRTDDEFYLERRPPSGIWGGLWSFPELDSPDELPAWCERTLSFRPRAVDTLEVLRHSFSHFDLDIVPHVVHVNAASGKVADNADGSWYPLGTRPPVGLAAPVETLLQSIDRRTVNPDAINTRSRQIP